MFSGCRGGVFEIRAGMIRCSLLLLLKLLDPLLKSNKITLKRALGRFRPDVPNVLAAGPSLIFDSFAAVAVLDGIPAFFLGHRIRAHAEPEIRPMFRAGAQVPVAIHIHPLAAEGLAEESVVEG